MKSLGAKAVQRIDGQGYNGQGASDPPEKLPPLPRAGESAQEYQAGTRHPNMVYGCCDQLDEPVDLSQLSDARAVVEEIQGMWPRP